MNLKNHYTVDLESTGVRLTVMVNFMSPALFDGAIVFLVHAATKNAVELRDGKLHAKFRGSSSHVMSLIWNRWPS